ncbi:hypothetical protein MP638_001895 [Amoeboaphelidium occidentale]|nr:hypothetical protein MP638_001895 [Amoeboaphelidium occidentale]
MMPHILALFSNKTTFESFWRSLQSNAVSFNTEKALLPYGDTVSSFFNGNARTSQVTNSDSVNVSCYTAGNTTHLTSFNAKTYFEGILKSTKFCGHTVLFTEEIESTQTFLEKWYNVLPLWPNGTLFLSDRQSCGRGRGQNKWMTPSGSLAMSLVVDWRNKSLGDLVFVQYIMALAAVEALKHFIPSIPAFIKWPNDIIVSADKNPAKFDKIGGILVNTSFHEENPRLIVGLGVNLSNKDGPKSVAQVADELNLQGSVPSRMLFIEEVLKRFEKLYVQLEHGDKSEFVVSYYRHWIHGNQVVRISKDVANLTPAIEDNSDHDEFITATIIGINDQGFLIAKRNDGIVYELQPGGNSFDLTRGMICKKLG